MAPRDIVYSLFSRNFNHLHSPRCCCCCRCRFYYVPLYSIPRSHCLIPLYFSHSYHPLSILVSTAPVFLDAPSHLYKRSCPSVRRSVGPSVGPVLFSKVKITHTRRILCRVSGLVISFVAISPSTLYIFVAAITFSVCLHFIPRYLSLIALYFARSYHLLIGIRLRLNSDYFFCNISSQRLRMTQK